MLTEKATTIKAHWFNWKNEDIRKSVYWCMVIVKPRATQTVLDLCVFGQQ